MIVLSINTNLTFVEMNNLQQTKNELMKSNLFLLNELKKVKEEQNRMREELHNLRVENEILKERFNKFLIVLNLFITFLFRFQVARLVDKKFRIHLQIDFF
jgi:predicted nuclease with TOPRIM domain